MTPEAKKVLKVALISVGIITIITVIAVLVIKKIQKDKEEKEADKEEPQSKTVYVHQTPTGGSSASASTTNTLNGRVYTRAEIEKMQSYLVHMGSVKNNMTIVKSIQDNGGIDGKIGSGFKAALKEALRIKMVNDQDDLYARAIKFYK